MSELVIIQITPEELDRKLTDAIDTAIQRVLSLKDEQPVPGPEQMKLMGVSQICEALGISRTRFEHYKDDLIRAGMFQLDGRGSAYRISKKDFDQWIDKKKPLTSRERADGCSPGS